ncbi:MAG: hypothetical protein AAFY48_23225 [Bacteroidota bacterium]
MIRILLVVGLTLFALNFLINCEKEEATPHLPYLYGDWRLKQLEINGRPSTNYTPLTIFGLLGLQETGRFYYDYNGGTWTLEGNLIKLQYGDSGPIFREYKVVYSSKDSLVLNAYQTEEDFYRDFPQFDSDETFFAVTYFGR